MKNLLITLLMLCLGFASLAGNDKTKISILLSEQTDATTLLRETAFFANKQARRDYVINTLKRQAAASQSELLSLLEEMGHLGMVEDVQPLWIVNAITCRADETAIDYLRQRNDVLSVTFCEQEQWIFENEAVPASRGDGREIAENLIQVNAPLVWEQDYLGQGVVIAIIDTGINYNHADLAGRLWDGGPDYPHHGYDFSDNDNDPMDHHGHGTHVAGTVCGTGVSGTQTGVAPAATIMALKAFNDQGEGDESQWIAAMQFALEHGADVINMSLGRPQPNTEQKRMIRQACDNTLAAGVVASVCAGNIRQMQFMVPVPYNIYTPGDCPPPSLHEDQLVNTGGTSCVICVGAVDSDDNLAAFSSEGPSQWTDVPEYGDYPYTASSTSEIGLIRPDVCAPGVQIKSLDYNNINGYTLMDGTSMATPCVAGTIALMLSKNPELTPAQIDDILEHTSVETRHGTSLRSQHKNNDFGSGRIDALAAVNAVDYNTTGEAKKQQVMIFPNPSANTFNIVCEGMKQVEVYTVDGQLMQRIETDTDTFQLNGLDNGIYLLQITTTNTRLIQKIVKL